MKTLQALAASPGIAIGPAFRFQRPEVRAARTTVADRTAEQARLQRALEAARAQLAEIAERASGEVGAEQAAIFQAQALMLEDPELVGQVEAAIAEQGLNAEAAWSDATAHYAELLEALDDEYLRARAADVRDVAARVLRCLAGVDDRPTAALASPAIVVAAELTPSDTALLDRSLVLGFCTARGGATSHVAILARSLGLPALVGAGPDILAIADGTPLLLDADEGVLRVEPSPDALAAACARQAADEALQRRARGRAHEPAVTRDGHRVEVVANIGDVAGAEAAMAAGAEGVGLLRSEFLYLDAPALPSEEAQYEAYRRILAICGQRPVVLRTLDIGGDKQLEAVDLPVEANPFLGLRAIRLGLARPELLKPQLRAALRAGVGHDLRLMFPMVATLAELRAARAMLDACRQELQAEGRPTADLQVGIMVEVPAAALLADRLAAEVDFFSIGTNDLSQYTMAADRTNAQVAQLADAFQPAVLRLVRDVIAAGHAHGRWVGVCGELAGEPLAVPILLGLELDEFSMNPPAVPIAKEIIRSLSMDEAREIAHAALELDSPDAVRALVSRVQKGR